MKKLSLICTALLLSACGGGSSYNDYPTPAPVPPPVVTPPAPPAPVADAYFTSVKTAAAAMPDDAEPVSIDAAVTTMPEDTEPGEV